MGDVEVAELSFSIMGNVEVVELIIFTIIPATVVRVPEDITTGGTVSSVRVINTITIAGDATVVIAVNQITTTISAGNVLKTT